MIYKVKFFNSIGAYRDFWEGEPNITIVSVNVTDYVYNGLQTNFYLTYYENEENTTDSDCTNDCTHFDNAVQYGYNKAIDEFAEAIKTNSKLGYIGYLDGVIDEIAEQLKGGSDK